MKFLRLLLIACFLYFGSLFSQPDYPEISFSELAQYSYEVISEGQDYFLVDIDGVIYIVFY